MSEFKYACPVCGQHIKCDSSQGGTVMTCPTCFQQIIVPNAPAGEDHKFILTGTKVGTERPVPKIAEPAPAAPPPASGFSGAIVVTIILIFIGAIVAAIYYETIFKAHTKPQPVANDNNVSSPASPAPAPTGSVNLALHMTASASTEQSQKPASNGNDGNPHTRWGALNKTVPQWWAVDLNNTAIVTNVQISWEHDVDYQYMIEVSPDNSTWTLVADQSTNQTPVQFTSDSFIARARYLRVMITGLPHGARASFFEFRAFGSIDDK